MTLTRFSLVALSLFLSLLFFFHLLAINLTLTRVFLKGGPEYENASISWAVDKSVRHSFD